MPTSGLAPGHAPWPVGPPGPDTPVHEGDDTLSRSRQHVAARPKKEAPAQGEVLDPPPTRAETDVVHGSPKVAMVHCCLVGRDAGRRRSVSLRPRGFRLLGRGVLKRVSSAL